MFVEKKEPLKLKILKTFFYIMFLTLGIVTCWLANCLVDFSIPIGNPFLIWGSVAFVFLISMFSYFSCFNNFVHNTPYMTFEEFTKKHELGLL
jgi:hypothetical protein